MTDLAPSGSVPPELAVSRQAPDRNLALELVRVTEAAAMAAARWVGRGDKNGGDGAAVDAMRTLIGTVSMDGVVVIGEGEKDHAPMLYNGEQVGDGTGPECDVAVDPIDGTTLMAKGMPNAIAVIAVAERGSMFDPSAVFYMEKIATGPEAADVIDITAPVQGEHRPGGQGQGRQARGRHGGDPGPAPARRPGRARCARPAPGSSSSPTATWPARSWRPGPGTGVDLLLGIGGTPEGIIAAAAISCMGGAIQGRLWPQTAEERQKAIDAGHDLSRVLTTRDLVTGEDVFFCATGITDGELVRGVRYDRGAVATSSIVMRSKSGHHPGRRLVAPAVQAAGVRLGGLRPQLGRLPTIASNGQPVPAHGYQERRHHALRHHERHPGLGDPAGLRRGVRGDRALPQRLLPDGCRLQVPGRRRAAGHDQATSSTAATRR